MPPPAAPAALEIELNKLEPLDGRCLAYLVFGNRTGLAFTALELELELCN